MSSRGDEGEFVRLLMQHQRQLYVYIRSLVFSRHDAEDLLQDVAVVLWRKYGEFRPGTSFGAWAHRIARNCVLDFYRRSKHAGRQLGEDVLHLIADESLVRLQHMDEFRDALDGCLSKLSERDRQLIHLRYASLETTSREIAQQLHSSESTVSRSLKRIRLALHSCLARALERREMLPLVEQGRAP